MSDLTQDKRIGSFTTPLGKDTLVLVKFDGSEGLSELFEYRIEALSKQEGLNFDGALGQKCSLTLKTYKGERNFSGILVEAEWLGAKDGHNGYRLVLRPTLWLLSRRSDSRIFAHQSVPDILKKVFEGLNCSFNIQGTFPPLEYCVQYRETDLAFASRLMEQYGIYYYFKHSADDHQLNVVNTTSAHKPIPNLESIPFIALTGDDRRDREHLYEWMSERRFRTGKIQLNDYDFKQPKKNLFADANSTETYANTKQQEFFDHPGDYTERDQGEKFAKIQMEAEQALDHRRYAIGDALSLYPGGSTKLERYPKDSGNYLVVRASHSFTSEHYGSGATTGPGEIYVGHYEFLNKDQQFRAPIVTPKPKVFGMHTAVVVGDPGEEIHTDEYGRIQVRFFWERRKDISRWTRVAHMWASTQWGTQFIPRVGMEVVVIYEEGDPDHPLVIGSVYNGNNKHPYKVPDNKTQSGVKSNSSLGGHGYNEFMFEDKKGSEFVRFHAEKDLKSVIEADETRNVGNNQTLTVGHDQTETIEHDRSVTILNRDTLMVASDQSNTVMGNRTTLVAQNEMLTADLILNVAVTGTIALVCGASVIWMTPGSIIITSPALIINAPTVINGGLIVNGAGVINGLPIV